METNTVGLPHDVSCNMIEQFEIIIMDLYCNESRVVRVLLVLLKSKGRRTGVSVT